MIKKLEITNFKSIKHLKLDCKRINILIGEPNTGKSNILESFGFFSYAGHSMQNDFKNFIRFERMSNLFYDEILDEPVQIKIDDLDFAFQFREGQFVGHFYRNVAALAQIGGGYDNLYFQGGVSEQFSHFKYYKFIVQREFSRLESDFLLPPSGSNLMSLILTHKNLRVLANEIFSKFGFELNLRPQEKKIEVLKRAEGITVSYPYSLTSDTLQRTIFHLFAILTNKDSVLVFEEPESHAFPYYTKYFAESVALDDRNNQFFISTHNPYLLLPILEKAPKDDVAIFITYFGNYQTKVRPLNDKEIEEVVEIDVFSNLDRFLESRGADDLSRVQSRLRVGKSLNRRSKKRNSP